MEHKYVIKEANEDPLKATISKENVTVDFNLADFTAQQEAVEKRLAEVRGQMDIECAKQKNVNQNHEDAIALVSGLDPVKQNAVRIWLNATYAINQLGPCKDKLIEAKKFDEEELKIILEQTGLKLEENNANKETDNKEETSKSTEETEDSSEKSGS